MFMTTTLLATFLCLLVLSKTTDGFQISYTSARSRSWQLSAADDGDDGFDLGELQKRIKQQEQQYLDFFMSDEDESNQPEMVHIVAFNVGTPDQGVHSVEFPKGSGTNILLAFESEQECQAFALELKQDSMQLLSPEPAESELEPLRNFCNAMGLPMRLVPAGTNLRPPADNVEEFSLDPNVREARERLNKQSLQDEPEQKGTDKKDDKSSDWE